MLEMHTPTISYTIDDLDRLVQVSDSFFSFASDNGVEDPRGWVGTDLWDHVSGEGVGALYRALLSRVRGQSAVITFSFRCDAPGEKRRCSLTLEGAGSGWVTFTSRIHETETRETIGLLDKERPRTSDLVLMCSICHGLSISEVWVPLEEAVAGIEERWATTDPMVSHGLCSACEQQILDELETVDSST